jgi:hypothetical protein
MIADEFNVKALWGISTTVTFRKAPMSETCMSGISLEMSKSGQKDGQTKGGVREDIGNRRLRGKGAAKGPDPSSSVTWTDRSTLKTIISDSVTKLNFDDVLLSHTFDIWSLSLCLLRFCWRATIEASRNVSWNYVAFYYSLHFGIKPDGK